MQKTRRIIAILIAIALSFCNYTFIYALESSHSRWPEFSGTDEWGYINHAAFVHFREIENGCRFNIEPWFFVNVSIPDNDSIDSLTVDYFTAGYGVDGKLTDTGIRIEEHTNQQINHKRIEAVDDSASDYSLIQYWRFYDTQSDRSVVLPVHAVVEESAKKEKSINRLAAFEERADRFVSIMRRLDALYKVLYASQNSTAIVIGGYHTSDINLICSIANSIQREFGIDVSYFDTHDYWVEGNGWTNATTEEVVNHWRTYINPKDGNLYIDPESCISQNDVENLDFLLDTVAPYWIDYVENHRIVKPEITYYSLNGSRGIIDPDTKTITIRMPLDTDWDNISDSVIRTSGESVCEVYRGSFSEKKVIYKVTPGDRATGTYYNGINKTGFEFGKNLGERWTLIIEDGVPFNQVISFSVKTSDGKQRCSEIIEGVDGQKGQIRLNLPYGTDLSSIHPDVDIAGEGYYFIVDGIRQEYDVNIDFSKSVELVVYNNKYASETVYILQITAEKSSENSILSYRIADSIAQIRGDSLSVIIPYAMDLSIVSPDIEVSEFAQITTSPETLKVGSNKYIVTAENGDTHTYWVVIKRTPASKKNQILSFKYGGYEGVINDADNVITIRIPNSISTTFAPTIEVSEFATVNPFSGEVKDFSSPVKYTVTAQDGSVREYIVTVIQEGSAQNVYKALLDDIVDTIITRYRSEASDDWEWMDLGLYERLLGNYNTGYEHDFDIANELSTLDTTSSVGMTEYARTVMMLTARGFDCTKLSQYNGGVPFIDKNGNEVDNLVSAMYSFSGTYTINGPAFTLIALDMGNYTVPEDALWTRDELLNVILGYTGSEFGIDMVGAIMYAIAPYQDDPVYGGLVRDRLNNCLNSVLSSMNSDYSFGAWGATNSESAAWVMMGLCSMGIDWHIDPRFSDGKGHSALQHWMDNFSNVQDGYFHHSKTLLNNYMATYEGCYASMWYLGFLEHGGQGNPYYFYYHRFDFSKHLSEDASILAFEIEGKQGVITEAEENSIVVTLANGTPLTDLKPVITFAEGAKLIAPSLPVTFVEGVKQPFTVCAEDGKTHKTYFVTIVYDDVQASGAELDTDTLALKNSVFNEESILDKTIAKASDGAMEILITVKPGVDTSRMYLCADVSYAASCDPVLDGGTAFDLSDWLTVTVTSEDGLTTNVYRIKVVAKAMAEITSFRVEADGIWYSGEIDNTANTIVVRDVDDSNLSSTELVTDIDFTGRTCQPTSGLAMDFAGAVTYTLGGDAELAGRSYTVKVLNKSGKFITAKSSGGNNDPSGEPGGNSGSNTEYGDAMILNFTLFGREGVIDQNAGTISITLPQGTNVSAVVPQITVSDGAAVSPASGQVVDLSSPVAFTVKHGNETKIYIVTVVFERSTSQQLWDAVMEESDVVDHQISHGRGIH